VTVVPEAVLRDGYQVVIMAKAPVPGEVKTRLCPPLTHHQAAALAAAALADTLEAALHSRAVRRVLALDGAPGPWLRPGFDLIWQRPGDFGIRLAGAIDDAWARLQVPVVVVGMDTPQLRSRDLDRAAAPLLVAGPTGAVLGPAEDGGYWAIGVRCPSPGMFDGVPMSTSITGAAQVERLAHLGLRCHLVGALRDVDRYDDAVAVAVEAPTTRFAALLATFVDRPEPLSAAPHG